jgi:hypothetical protein
MRKAADHLVFRPSAAYRNPFKIQDRGLGDEDVADRKQVGRDTPWTASSCGSSEQACGTGTFVKPVADNL